MIVVLWHINMLSTRLKLLFKMSIGIMGVGLIIFVENPILEKILKKNPVFWAALDFLKIFLRRNFFYVFLTWFLASSKRLSVFFGLKISALSVVPPSTPVTQTLIILTSGRAKL